MVDGHPVTRPIALERGSDELYRVPDATQPPSSPDAPSERCGGCDTPTARASGVCQRCSVAALDRRAARLRAELGVLVLEYRALALEAAHPELVDDLTELEARAAWGDR